MIFKVGDIIRGINREDHSFHCPTWTPEGKRVNEIAEANNLVWDRGPLQFFNMTEFEVIEYLNPEIFCAKSVEGNYLVVLSEDKVRYADGRAKEYNMPSFRNTEIKKITIRGRVVKVLLDDGATGESICSDKDYFDENKGIEIAYLRAKANSIGGKK